MGIKQSVRVLSALARKLVVFATRPQTPIYPLAAKGTFLHHSMRLPKQKQSERSQAPIKIW